MIEINDFLSLQNSLPFIIHFFKQSTFLRFLQKKKKFTKKKKIKPQEMKLYWNNSKKENPFPKHGDHLS